MKKRNDLLQLKNQLGGQCIECGTTELFKLEFDHINSELKTKQITRIHPDKLEKELENIQLLCNMCHRIKSFNEQKIIRNKNSKDDNKNIVKEIKRKIGGCQVCKWSHKDDNILSYCLDFDHILGDKINQISNLYSNTRETLLNEILKCRLLCRSCHQMWTCFQRGGKMLSIYYNKEQIQNFRNLLDNSDKNIEYNNKIKDIVQKYFITPIDITNFDDLKNFETFYKINKNGDIYSIRNKSLMKKTTKIDGNISVILQGKTYYINDLLFLQYNS
jgi:hypothetical protein